MRTALVHDWLTTRAGSERVLESMLELFPANRVFTLLGKREAFAESPLHTADVETSFMQRLPGARTRYRSYLPLMPLAIEQFDLSDFDLVVSNVKAVSHGVITRPDQLHVAYVNRPMRYAWDLYHEELRAFRLTGGLRSALARVFLHYLRLWDQQAMRRPDVIAVNSRAVQRMVAKYHRRKAEVIHPPVDVGEFECDGQRDGYYVTLARLVPYKRVDLVVGAFNRLGLPLKVIGDGPMEGRIRATARPNVEFLGWIPRSQVRSHLQATRALVFAANEEFGIAPVEAQAAGAPVIAFAGGGATETVIHGETGILFPEQTVDSVVDAVRAFESGDYRFDPERLRENAERFSVDRFRERFSRLVDRSMESFTAASRDDHP